MTKGERTYAGTKGPKNFQEAQEIASQVDLVNHSPHYKAHSSGIECITISEHFNFCLGNAIKYIWRAGEKGNKLEDLQKARWYLDREIKRLENS